VDAPDSRVEPVEGLLGVLLGLGSWRAAGWRCRPSRIGTASC
jgi:hypothetical protein